MTTLELTGTDLGGPRDAPLLVVGPSLGTGVAALWQQVADVVGDRAWVVGWDLPGHGSSRVPVAAFTVADVAAGVLDLLDRVAPGRLAHLAGDSFGGAVSLELALQAPERVETLTVLCSGARIGTAEAWRERAALVRASGTSAVIAGSAERWFGPRFMDREPALASALLHDLAHVDDEGYALVCEALADFDVVDRLHEVRVPVLAVAGSHDAPTPVESLRTVADGVRRGHLVVLDGVAHLAPVEAPHDVSRLLLEHLDVFPHAGLHPSEGIS